MSFNSKIEWTDATWNPITGCSKTSEGCRNCYAERLSNRLQKMGNRRYLNGFDVTLHRDLLNLPFKWKKQKFVFVNSMSDIFHEDVPDEFILKIFDTMTIANQHIYQVLTKRSTRMKEFLRSVNITDNIWIGVTVENSDNLHRLDNLRQIKAKTRFISLEPLIGEITNIDLKNISWVITGGESGSNARPIQEEWVTQIRDQCIKENVPFFFKQWGGVNKKKAGRLLEGKTWDQFPKQ